MNEINSTIAINPVAPYLGGKRLLAKTIVPIIEAVPHKNYVEPFVGMGGVFFRRTKRTKCEVINDISKDIANLFRILQRHYPQFLDTLKYQLSSRSEFERLKATDPTTLTDLERAARFIYLQKTAFGGKATSQTFGIATERSSRFNLNTLASQLEDVHDRLAYVTIECLPYAQCITRYDRDQTLFYLDPPYWNCENDYGKNLFSKSDFEYLAQQLGSIKGKFLMSINDTPEVRFIFERFSMQPVKTRYTVNPQSGKEVGELLISNFEVKI
ncbi:DNA adenine methylase [Maritalea porphyrae]|uniref:DNA adenine methylase n=1 Tax=Maritalea porphyrae TaxID=880732 RepID=UPI0022AE9349|nr:DNA adenine methylase [Maritalea porphyrae]MCZ4273288.1 DNA adenine methylase [Maritalea porphyrae]